MRLDTDSYIYQPLCYDPIELFHEHNRTYAYRSRTTDPDWVTIGMWNLVDEYSRAHPEVDRQLEKNGWTWPDGKRENVKPEGLDFPTYYNNFEIVKLESFRRPDVRAWLDEIMRVPERIYKYRWGMWFYYAPDVINDTKIETGDAPIRYATVSMFFDVEKDVEEYCGMQYWHNGIRGSVCKCSSQLRSH